MEALSKDQVQQFIAKGFVKLEGAFSKDVAFRAREILWRDTGCDPMDKSTWKRPVVRLGDYAQAPFAEAANTPRLHAAFDQLVGEGRWLPRGGLGSFPVRFPSDEDPGDAGWHVDASFPGEDESFFRGASTSIRKAAHCSCSFYFRTSASAMRPRAFAQAHITSSRECWSRQERRECRSWSWPLN